MTIATDFGGLNDTNTRNTRQRKGVSPREIATALQKFKVVAYPKLEVCGIVFCAF